MWAPTAISHRQLVDLVSHNLGPTFLNRKIDKCLKYKEKRKKKHRYLLFLFLLVELLSYYYFYFKQ